MTGNTVWWALVIVALAAGVVGFLLGRGGGKGRQQVEECERKIAEKEAELLRYREEVESHFDRTAGLFVSMAGSYKELFEHLSSGYGKLTDGASKEHFRERVAMQLVDGRELQPAESEEPVGAESGSDETVADEQENRTEPEGIAENETTAGEKLAEVNADATDEIEKFGEAVRTFERSPQGGLPEAEREPFVGEEPVPAEGETVGEPKELRS